MGKKREIKTTSNESYECSEANRSEPECSKEDFFNVRDPLITDQGLGFEDQSENENMANSQERGEDPRPEEIEVETPKLPESFNFKSKIFCEKEIGPPNKNTPRLLVRLAVKYMSSYRKLYGKSSRIFQRVCSELDDLQRWHQEEHGNVYLMKHLINLFSNEETFSRRGCKLNRMIFRQIILDNCKYEMNFAKSQISAKNKLDYYRCLKLYALRCKSVDLCERNQLR